MTPTFEIQGQVSTVFVKEIVSVVLKLSAYLDTFDSRHQAYVFLFVCESLSKMFWIWQEDANVVILHRFSDYACWLVTSVAPSVKPESRYHSRVDETQRLGCPDNGKWGFLVHPS